MQASSKQSKIGRICIIVDQPYNDDTKEGILFSGPDGRFLLDAMQEMFYKVDDDVTVLSMHNKTTVINSLVTIPPHFVICMGKEAWKFIVGNSTTVDFETSMISNDVFGVDLIGTSRSVWCMALQLPHDIKRLTDMSIQTHDDKAYVQAWKTKLRQVASYLKKGVCKTLTEYKCTTASVLPSTGKWDYPTPVRTFPYDVGQIIPFSALFAEYLSKVDELWLFGTVTTDMRSMAVKVQNFLYHTCVESHSTIVFEEIRNELRTSVEYGLRNANTKERLDLLAIPSIRLSEITMVDLETLKEITAIKIECNSWRMTKYITGLVVNWIKDFYPIVPARRVYGKSNDNMPVEQYSAKHHIIFRAVMKVPYVATELKGMRSTILTKFGGPPSMSINPLVHERGHRAIYLHVFYGGNTNDKSGYHIYGIVLGGETSECHFVGYNGIRSETELITHMCHRLMSIDSFLIVGYEVKKDIYLIFQRAIFLKMQLNALIRAFSRYTPELRPDRNPKCPLRVTKFNGSYPLRVVNGAIEYDAHAFVGVAFMDIKELVIRFRGAIDPILTVYEENTWNISDDDLYKMMQKEGGNVQYVDELCRLGRSRVGMLRKFVDDGNFFKTLDNLCYRSYCRYSFKNVLEASAENLAIACRFNLDFYKYHDGLVKTIPRLRRLDYLKRCSSYYTENWTHAMKTSGLSIPKQNGSFINTIREAMFETTNDYVTQYDETMLVFSTFRVMATVAEKKDLCGFGQLLAGIRESMKTAHKINARAGRTALKLIMDSMLYVIQITYPSFKEMVAEYVKSVIENVRDIQSIYTDLLGRIIIVIKSNVDYAHIVERMARSRYRLKNVLKGGIVWGKYLSYAGIDIREPIDDIVIKCDDAIEKKLVSSIIGTYITDRNKRNVVSAFQGLVRNFDGPWVLFRTLYHVPQMPRLDSGNTLNNLITVGNYGLMDTVPYCIDRRTGVHHPSRAKTIVPNTDLYIFYTIRRPLTPFANLLKFPVIRKYKSITSSSSAKESSDDDDAEPTNTLHKAGFVQNSGIVPCMKCGIYCDVPICYECQTMPSLIDDIEDLIVPAIHSNIASSTTDFNACMTKCKTCVNMITRDTVPEKVMTDIIFGCSQYSCTNNGLLQKAKHDLFIAKNNLSFVTDLKTTCNNKKQRS